MKTTNNAANIINLARAAVTPSIDAVIYGNDADKLNTYDYVDMLFKSHAADKLNSITAPAPYAVAVAETLESDNEDAAAVVEYAAVVVPARDAVDAIATGHAAMDAAADIAARRIARRAVTLDFITAPEMIMDAARAVARNTAKNAVMREGTETQEQIYRTARARRDCFMPWEDSTDTMFSAAQNYSDMIQAAADAIVMALYEDAATLARRAAAMDAAARKLHDIPVGYTTAREIVLNTARRALCNDETGRAAVVDDNAKIRARARDTMDAARAVFAARHIAYRAVNNYLTDARAIRVKESPAPLSLNTISADIAEIIAPADDITARAVVARRDALNNALAIMPPTMADTCRRLARGYSIRAAARAVGRDESTIRGHRDAARAIIAAQLAEMDAAAARAVGVQNIVAAPDDAAATIAAALDNAAARAARRARDTVPAALVDAARNGNAAAMLKAVHDIENYCMSDIQATIYAYYCDGCGVREIARSMSRSVGTVSKHAANIAAALVAALYDAAALEMPDNVVVSLPALVTFLKSIA